MVGNNVFAAKLRKAREARGFSKSELARRVGVTPSAVVGWEKGSVSPRPETLRVLKALLGLEDGSGADTAPTDSASVSDNSADSIIEDFKKRLALKTGHPVERIAVQVTLT